MWNGALEGMNTQAEHAQRANLAQLQAMAAMQGIGKSDADATAIAGTRQREAQFRAKLSELQNPTHEQVRALALQSGLIAPKDVLTNDLGIYKADTGKEIAKTRIEAAQAEHDRQYELAKKRVSNAEQAAQLDAWYKQGRMSLDQAKAAYGLPPDLQPSIPSAPLSAMPGAPQAPQAPAQTAPQSAPIAPQTPPDVSAGIQQLNANAPAQIAAAAPIIARESMPNGGGAIPTNAVIPTSAPPPVAPMNAVPVKSPISQMNGAPQAPAASPISQMNGAPQAPVETPKPANWASLSRKDQDAWQKAQSKATGGAIGNRESVFINRVVLSGNEAARDLENVVKLPMTSSTGLLGGRGQEQGIMNAVKETLANKMTGQDAQSYNVLSAGFQRSLAAIEAAGLAPSGTLSHQMDAVIFKEGDTNFTKLQKLAQTRQIVEAGLESIATNPRVPKETRDHIQAIIDKTAKAVPFTQEDLINLQSQQKINPKITLKDVIGSKGNAPYADTEKERRYQEWKRANP